jgi:hypothetical protein
MSLDRRIMSVGIIVLVFTAMLPFSAIVMLSMAGPEAMSQGIQNIFFYLGWFINPIIMIIAGIIVMRLSHSREFSRALLAGIILGLVYTLAILGIQFTFISEGSAFLPISDSEIPGGLASLLHGLVPGAWAFCIAGCLLGAFTVSRGAGPPEE